MASAASPNDTSGLRPLRLAMVAHRFQKNDGQGRVNYEVARAALQAGMDVTLVTAHCAEDIAKHANATVVRLGRERFPTQLARNIGFASESASWLRRNREQFDLVQGNGFITWEPCDIVTVHFVHTAWIDNPYYPYRGLRPYALYQRIFSHLNARWEQRAFRSARHIIAVSELVAADVSALGVPSERIEVINNGVSTDEFHTGSAERASFNLPEGVPIAAFVGDIRTPRKNLATLLQAIAKVPLLHLAVAGDPTGSPAPGLARSLGISDRVHFLGKISRVAALMRSVDMFCFPSLYEPFGLVVLEAVASQLPVVASRSVGATKGLGDGCILLQNPDDPGELAMVLNHLVASPELLLSMREALSAQDMEVGWSKTVKGYLQTYADLRPHHL